MYYVQSEDNCTIILTNTIHYTSAAYEQRGVSDTCHSSPSRTDPDSALQGQGSTNSNQGEGSGLHKKYKNNFSEKVTHQAAQRSY